MNTTKKETVKAAVPPLTRSDRRKEVTIYGLLRSVEPRTYIELTDNRWNVRTLTNCANVANCVLGARRYVVVNNNRTSGKIMICNFDGLPEGEVLAERPSKYTYDDVFNAKN